MDKKTINNKNVTAVVRFVCFLFEPYFTHGQRAGVFYLEAFHPERACYIVTSNIVDIHEIDGVVYIETQNSVYELDGTKKIYYLEDVKRYLHDDKYTSNEFYDKCVPNRMPTIRGWKIF